MFTKMNYPIWKKVYLSFAVMTALSCIPANECIAHKLMIYAWLQDHTIYGEAAYNDGILAGSCRVTIFDGKNNLIGKIKTDKEGKFSFQLTQIPVAPFKIVINDGMGHRDEYIISKEDFS